MTTTKGVQRVEEMDENGRSLERNLAKEMGLVQPPEQSGRGQWELTEKGRPGPLIKFNATI